MLIIIPDAMWQAMHRSDRRLDRRYLFEVPLRFCSERHRDTCAGVGQTIELGTGAVLFDTGCLLSRGENLELELTWPFLLQEVCPVVLVIRGPVIRIDPRGAVVRMRDYEFRAAGRYCLDTALELGAACNMIG